MFVVQSFEIYNGCAGFFDFGPPACALKSHMLQAWRNHFVLEDDMLEVETTDIMTKVVLKTSGHVDKFSDFCVKDEVTGECYRADKLLEDHIDRFIESNPTLNEKIREVI